MQETYNGAPRLREERERLELTQAAVAQAAGVSAVSQYNYENGKRNPDAAYLAAVAKLGVDVTYVVTGERGQAMEIMGAVRLMSEAWEALEAHLQTTGRTLPPAKKRAAAEALYQLSSEHGLVQPGMVAMLAQVAA